MHRMQSGGWPYSEDGRDSSKAPSLRVAFLRTATATVQHVIVGKPSQLAVSLLFVYAICIHHAQRRCYNGYISL